MIKAKTQKKRVLKWSLLAWCFLLSAGGGARAEEKIEVERFEPFHWTPGLHLIAGAGGNMSLYRSDSQTDVVGGGMNLHTDVGYYFNNDLAFEVNASVMFNQVRGLLIWDTVGLVGLRYRIKYLDLGENVAPFGRILAGPSVSVILGDVPEEQDIGGDRNHFQGQAVGLGFGAFQKATSGNVWFMEFLLIAQEYRKVEAVTVIDEVPVVVSSMELDNHTRLYSIILSFGVVAF